MNSNSLLRNKKDRQRNVFRTKRKNIKKGPLRLSLESFIMLALGMTLLLFLNWLPKRLELIQLVTSSYNSALAGFSLLFDSITSISIVILTISLIILSIILISGSIWRFLRLLSLYVLKRRNNNYSKK